MFLDRIRFVLQIYNILITALICMQHSFASTILKDFLPKEIKMIFKFAQVTLFLCYNFCAVKYVDNDTFKVARKNYSRLFHCRVREDCEIIATKESGSQKDLSE